MTTMTENGRSMVIDATSGRAFVAGTEAAALALRNAWRKAGCPGQPYVPQKVRRNRQKR